MAKTSALSRLKIIIWKNLIIRKHHWLVTLLEIVIPTVIFGLMSFFRAKLGQIGQIYIDTPIKPPSYSFKNILLHFKPETNIYYAPDVAFTSALIGKAQSKLKVKSNSVRGFKNQEDLMLYYQLHFKNTSNIMAIIFKEVYGKEPPKRLQYVMRPWLRDGPLNTMLFDVVVLYTPEVGSKAYIESGLVALQMALDTSFIEITSKKKLPVDFTIQEFPYPPFKSDLGLAIVYQYILPIITAFGFIVLITAVLKRVTEEKMTGIKELMMMMGLKSWMLWLGWIFHSLIVICICVILITAFMKLKVFGSSYPAIENCSASVLAIFLLLYCITGTVYCFFIGSIFNKPIVAMTVGLLVWIIPIFAISTLTSSPNTTFAIKCLLGLFPNTALNFGYAAIATYEKRRIGSQWNNLFISASGNAEDVTLGMVFIIFLTDCAIFMLLTFYIENINPGPYGVAKPFHFPVSRIWRRVCRRNNRVKDDDEESLYEYSTKIEDAPALKTGIEVRNLYKKYGKQVAVNNFSINIYEAQITALLGHNGAGKTTTMSIITGMISSTSGKVLINNKDIKYNMNKIRKSLGFCPQENLHFTDLTVIEHLLFFGMLKGLSYKNADREAIQLLQKMRLYGKRNRRSFQLSGGMKRKLSLGIALIGNSKILILDEPTSGLDPESRRDIWDLLLSSRGSRTIIITTHFMEEADVLGDRIAIMDHGRLICYGTSMFLKNEYGTGYTLTLMRDEEAYLRATESNSDQVEVITAIVHGRIKSAVLLLTGNKLTYLLPHETKGYFGDLLGTLENKKEELCITNMGLSFTTLEEVFLNVGDAVAEEDGRKHHGENSRAQHSDDSNLDFTTNSLPKCTGCKLLLLQLKTLFKKRWYVFTGKWLLYAVSVIAAILITLFTLYQGDPQKTNYDTNDVVHFTLKDYGKTLVLYGSLGKNPLFAKIEAKYSSVVRDQRGKPKKVTSVSAAIINKGIENIAYYERSMIVAAEFVAKSRKKTINAMYSNGATRGAPISVNLLMNAVLKTTVGDDYSISTSVSELPNLEETSLFEVSKANIYVLWIFLLPLGLLVVTCTFVLFPHMERSTNIKQLQLMCGVRSIWYWLACYVFDLMLYLIVMVLILLCITCYGFYGSKAFSGAKELYILSLIFLAYGLSMIPYTYLFSYKKTAAGAFAFCLMISLLLSLIIVGIAMYLILFHNTWTYIVTRACMSFPYLGLLLMLLEFVEKATWNYNWNIKSEQYKKTMCLVEPNPCCDGDNTPACIRFRSYFTGTDEIHPYTMLALMAGSMIIYLAILLLLETTCVRKLWELLLRYVYNKIGGKRSTLSADNQEDREDVRNEAERIAELLRSERTTRTDYGDLLLVHKLEKMYFGHRAVKGVSFAVKSGECFGLLGVNGAGKTTTFRVLTGDVPLVTGNARILLPSKKELYLSKHPHEFLKQVGYCPQFDAINPILTGRQMLGLFADLRGITTGKEGEINKWLKALGFEEYADKRCGLYSGGNKRKLNVAIALLGELPLVMMDEPTSGVDPVSRHKLWKTLASIKKQTVKPSIILTSHSMEECEALCDKLAIMKAGRLECYGTIPNIKKQYAQGFTVMLKIKQGLTGTNIQARNSDDSSNDSIILSQRGPDVVEDSHEVKILMAVFEEKYKGFCILRDKNAALLTYQITDKHKNWSHMFKEMESLQYKYPVIEDYNINETTLEEVFLSIARARN